LLFRVFNTIDYNPSEAWFAKPVDCEERLVCPETGMMPADHCPHVVSDYYIPNISGMQTCNHEQQLAISDDEKISYCKTCEPLTGYRLKWYPVLENSVQQWYADHRIHFEKIPAHNPTCEKVFREGAPVILSPHQGTEFLLSKNSPEPLLLNSRSQDNNSRIYWYINDRFYRMGSRVFYLPSEGPLKISCTDDKGRIRSVSVSVKWVDL
jgi:penicillin-binding protein 1C